MRTEITLDELLTFEFINLKDVDKDTVYLYEIILDNVDIIDNIYMDESSIFILDDYDNEIYICYIDLEFYILPQSIFDKDLIIKHTVDIEISNLNLEIERCKINMDKLDCSLDYWIDRYTLAVMELNLFLNKNP